MTKLNVYIDFEAISVPFCKWAKLPNDFAYAYSLGIFVGNKFKTKTFIFNFSNTSTDSYVEELRFSIIESIKSIKGKGFVVNSNTIQFVGWSPNLEQRVLSKVMRGIDVAALNNGYELSLSRLTPEYNKNYFAELKKLVNKNIDPDFVKRRGMDQDGALAAYAGYILHAKIHNKTNRYFFEIDTKILVREIKEYSADDVKRMAFLIQDEALWNERKEKAIRLMREKQKAIKDIARVTRLQKALQDFDKEKTIEMILDELQKKEANLEDKKEVIQKSFDKL